MPQYLNFTPEYKERSLQDYLYVPQLIEKEESTKQAQQTSRQTTYDKLADKMAALKNTYQDTPEVLSQVSEYEDALENLQEQILSNASPSEYMTAYRNASSIWRNNLSKYEAALPYYAKYKAYGNKPSIIGGQYTAADFAENPYLDYDYIDTKDLYNQAAKSFENYRNTMTPYNERNGSELITNIRGVNNDDIKAAFGTGELDENSRASYLHNILESYRDASGYYDYPEGSQIRQQIDFVLESAMNKAHKNSSSSSRYIAPKQQSISARNQARTAKWLEDGYTRDSHGNYVKDLGNGTVSIHRTDQGNAEDIKTNEEYNKMYKSSKSGSSKKDVDDSEYVDMYFRFGEDKDNSGNRYASDKPGEDYTEFTGSQIESVFRSLPGIDALVKEDTYTKNRSRYSFYVNNKYIITNEDGTKSLDSKKIKKNINKLGYKDLADMIILKRKALHRE